jgi:pyruvate/2-oxoglutarate/acetoin dehydrogenase E1 component
MLGERLVDGIPHRQLAAHRLLERFGRGRVIDTAIAETGFIGASVGVALAGLRPVAEIM